MKEKKVKKVTVSLTEGDIKTLIESWKNLDMRPSFSAYIAYLALKGVRK